MKLVQIIKRYPYLVFLAAALIILLPLFKPGYVLTLDMVFTPDTTVPTANLAGFPFYGLLWLFNVILPGDVVQKLVLTAVFVAAGTGMYKLTQLLQPKTDVAWDIPAFFAGLLYIFNPFVYSRFMAGQFMLLLGYALLPWFIWSLARFVRSPSIMRAVCPALFAAGMATVSLHMLGAAFVVALVAIGGLFLNKRKDRKGLIYSGKLVGVGAAAFMVITSYWMIPFLRGQNRASELVQSFTGSDRIAFATSGEGIEKILNIVTLQGFWADNQSLYITAAERFGWWKIVLGAVAILVFAGFVTLCQSYRQIAIGAGIVWAITVILACGTSGTLFAPLNQALTDTVPFFTGYREPQKFVALLCILYAMCAAFGLANIWQYAKKHKHPIDQREVFVLATTLPLLFAPLMPWGFKGQLVAQEYPRDWYQLQEKLDMLPPGQIVFLPWHHYMRFDFAGRIIANPADRFFDQKIIMSNNPELKQLNNWDNTYEQQIIEEQILPKALSGEKDTGRRLETLGMRYVILAKEHDYRKYDFLRQEPDLRLIQDSQTVQLYEVVK